MGCAAVVACCFLTALFGLLVFFLSFLGGALSRASGGWVDFGQRNATANYADASATHSDCGLCLQYWAAYLCRNLVFAVPTCVVMLVFSLHLRGSLIVAVMTWASMYVSIVVYSCVGTEDDYCFRNQSGVFDWLLGRQLNANWTFQERFVREYSGMSLRGLVWTAPPGYALQQLGFGWEYSLSGSLMGLFYLIGTHTPLSDDRSIGQTFDSVAAYSEFYWGWWVWFVLIISSLSQLQRRIHVWIYSKNQYLGFNPYSRWELFKHKPLNNALTRWSYEAVMVAFNLVLCCSAVYYSLVVQDDVRNKGQTFFGLFASILFLTLAQGWVWGMAWMKRRMKRIIEYHKKQRYSLSLGLSIDTTFSEVQPLLRHSDRAHSPEPSSHVARSNTLMFPEGFPGGSSVDHNSDSYSTFANTHRSTLEDPPIHIATFLTFWPSFEKLVWLDIFLWLRHAVGLVSVLATISVVVTTIIALVLDLHSPRLLN